MDAKRPKGLVLYIYFACLSGCLSVCIPQKSKLWNRSGQNFARDLGLGTIRLFWNRSVPF